MKRIKKANLRAVELQKQKKMKIRFLVSAGLLLLVIILAGIYLIRRNNIVYNGYQIIKTTELSGSNGMRFLEYKGGVLAYNRDGIRAISSNGTVIWDVSYSMRDPVGSVCGSYVAVGDRGGKEVVIINGTGQDNRLTMLHTIEEIEIASQGVVVVCMSEGNNNYISAYSMDSTDANNVIYDIETTQLDGFPLDIAVSQNGKKMATSYMKVENDTIAGQVTFYNFGEVGENKINNMVGSYVLEEQTIAPKLVFLNMNLACAFTDRGFYLFSIKEISSVLKIEKFSDEIENVFYNDTYFGVILKNAKGSEKHRIIIYDFSGEKVLDMATNENFQRVVLSGSDLLLYQKMSCVMFDKKGSEKFRTEFEKNVNQIIPVNGSDTFLLIGETSIETVRLSETKEN